MSDIRDLDQQAVSILRTNDRGGYTVPTARLYPFQWNWDSALSALGFATFDLGRAWTEIETLFEGQWADGMVPHIVFRRDDPDYFPGPSVWGTVNDPPTSGHSQPPVAATVVRALYERDPPVGAERARALYPRLLAWHRWYHTARDPDGLGVIAVVHPWESGRDNAPDWDGAMAHVDPTRAREYVRRDTGHVDPSMRPTKDDYDRYMSIVEFGRGCGWDPAVMARGAPFFVADPGVTMILLRADRDLLALATALDIDDGRDALADWVAGAEAGMDLLWNEAVGAYAARDLRTGMLADGPSSTAFLAWYARLEGGSHTATLKAGLRRVLAAVRYGVPSFDPAHAKFDSRRYWRGPVWGVINYMIGRGLAEADEPELAERIRGDTRQLIEMSGFQEYFDPQDGTGAGGGSFSWTAAMWLAWASPSAPQG